MNICFVAILPSSVRLLEIKKGTYDIFICIELKVKD